MKKAILLVVLAPGLVGADAPSPGLEEEHPAMHATGSFDVELEPRPADSPQAETAGLSRLSLAKQYHGGLEAASHGEMMAAGDGTESGAYVAIEKVTGSLDGRRGSFLLVHSAVLRRGAPEDWTVKVVPDSGTAQLEGLEGSMIIRAEGKQHFYELSYTLPPT